MGVKLTGEQCSRCGVELELGSGPRSGIKVGQTKVNGPYKEIMCLKCYDYLRPARYGNE